MLNALCDACGRLRAHIQDHVLLCYLGGELHLSPVPLVDARRHHHIEGQGNVHLIHEPPGRLNQIPLTQRLAHRVSGGGEEGIGDTATHHETVTLLGELIQHFQLGRHLGAANHRQHRFLRPGQSALQRREFSVE